MRWRRLALAILVYVRLRAINPLLILLVGSEGSKLLGADVVLAKALGAASSGLRIEAGLMKG